MAAELSGKAALTAAINLTPQRSQIAVVAVFGLALVGLCMTAAFGWYAKPFAWVFGAFTAAIFASGVWMWWRSHQQEAEATKVTARRDSVQIQTPATTFTNQEVFRRFHDMLGTLANRQALPVPDGLLDRHLKPIPDSRQRAVDVAQAINSQAGELQRAALDALAQPRQGQPAKRAANALRAKRADEPAQPVGSIS